MTRKLMVLALVAFGTVGFTACNGDEPGATDVDTDTDTDSDSDTDSGSAG